MNWVKKKYFELTSAKPVKLTERQTNRFSLVVSSFSREKNVIDIVNQYSTYACFAEIIVWHNGSNPLQFDYNDQKVKIINSDDMGLASRYAAALLAKSRTVFLHDDDLVVPESSFIEMAEKHTELNRTISIEGKIPHSDGTYGKTVKPSIGTEEECEIHLNRCICTSRPTISSFFTFLNETELTLNPKGGGGEDIVYSYAARLVTGNKPLALGVPFKNLDSSVAISARFGNQHTNRTTIMKICQEIFEKKSSNKNSPSDNS